MNERENWLNKIFIDRYQLQCRRRYFKQRVYANENEPDQRIVKAKRV